jgi:polyketide biosynthesis acyl carrier protein
MTESTTADRTRILREIGAAIREIVPTVRPEDIRGDRHLRELGADSVDRVEIILAVLDRLGVTEPLASFGPLPDLDAMADLLLDRVTR